MMNYHQKESIRTRNLLGNTILVDIQSNGYYNNPVMLQINPVGAFIWKCLSEPITITEIIKRLNEVLTDKEVEKDMEKDVLEFLDTLERIGYIIRCEG